MLHQYRPSPSMVGKILSRRQLVNLEPSGFRDRLARSQIHCSWEGEIVEDQVPSLIVSDEGFDLSQFQGGLFDSNLFLQNALGSLIRMFQVMQIIVGEEPSLLTIRTHLVFHE